MDRFSLYDNDIYPLRNPRRFWLVNLDVVGRGALALLVLSVLVGEMGIDLDHLQALVAEMALEGEALAPTSARSEWPTSGDRCGPRRACP